MTKTPFFYWLDLVYVLRSCALNILVNTRCAEILYDLIREWSEITSNTVILGMIIEVQAHVKLVYQIW